MKSLKLNYEIEHKKWEYKKFEKDLKQIDIGLINFMLVKKTFSMHLDSENIKQISILDLKARLI